MIVAAVFSILISAHSAAASGMTPCGMFRTGTGGRYNIGDAYAAADLVAIGQVIPKSSITLRISKKIKGGEKSTDVALTVPTCQGTACSGGFSVMPGVDLLFLLKRLPNGVYDGVSGNGNFSCPTVFEVKDGAALIAKKKIAVKSLRKYLESKPEPIPMY